MNTKLPVFVAFGWCNIFYFIYQITRQITFRLSNHPRYLWIVGFVGGLVGLCVDLFFDPVAASLNWWDWKNGGPYYGVPTANFVGWFFFGGGFCFAYNLVLSKNWKFRKKVIRFYLLLFTVFAITAICSFPFLKKDKSVLINHGLQSGSLCFDINCAKVLAPYSQSCFIWK